MSWECIRHNLYKSTSGEYHICGEKCDRASFPSWVCPVSRMNIKSRRIVTLRHNAIVSYENSIFSLLWMQIMNGEREKLHKSALIRIEDCEYEDCHSAFGVLECIRSRYHKLTSSYHPYSWVSLLDDNSSSLRFELNKLAGGLHSMYQMKWMSSVRCNHSLTNITRVVARIVADGLLLRQNIVLFDRNYLLMSALPPAIRTKRCRIRKAILEHLRTTSDWVDIRSIFRRD